MIVDTRVKAPTHAVTYIRGRKVSLCGEHGADDGDPLEYCVKKTTCVKCIKLIEEASSHEYCVKCTVPVAVAFVICAGALGFAAVAVVWWLENFA